MKYRRFEDLPVWKDAIELAVRVFALTAKPAFRPYRGIRDQIERSSVSVSNNVAEGFERGTTPELLTFLYISRGSAGETRSLICLIDRLPGFEDLRSEIKSREHFAPTPRLGRLDAKLRHSGSAVSNRQDQARN